jgi:hypothetical protein
MYLCIVSYLGIFGDFGPKVSYRREVKYLSIAVSLFYSAILLVRMRRMDRGWRIVSYLMILLAAIAIVLASYAIYRGY